MTEDTEDTEDNPGIVAPPIHLSHRSTGRGQARLPVAGCAAAEWGSIRRRIRRHRCEPRHRGGRSARVRRRTSFSPFDPATALVTNGPYRFSRNPGYLVLTLAHIGITVAADIVWMLALLLPALAIVRYSVIAREERYLGG